MTDAFHVSQYVLRPAGTPISAAQKYAYRNPDGGISESDGNPTDWVVPEGLIVWTPPQIPGLSDLSRDPADPTLATVHVDGYSETGYWYMKDSRIHPVKKIGPVEAFEVTRVEILRVPGPGETIISMNELDLLLSWTGQTGYPIDDPVAVVVDKFEEQVREWVASA